MHTGNVEAGPESSSACGLGSSLNAPGWLAKLRLIQIQFNFGVLTIRIINDLRNGIDGDYVHHGALSFQVVQGHLLVGAAQPRGQLLPAQRHRVGGQDADDKDAFRPNGEDGNTTDKDKPSLDGCGTLEWIEWITGWGEVYMEHPQWK